MTASIEKCKRTLISFVLIVSAYSAMCMTSRDIRSVRTFCCENILNVIKSAVTVSSISAVLKCPDVAAEDGFLESSWYNPQNQRIFDTLRKSFVPPHPEIYLRKELSKKSVVIIGEVHSNPCHHRLELDIIRSLAVGPDAVPSMTIGLEAFYRQHQAALDRYIFEHKNFEKLQSDTNWREVWGFDLNFYAKIFNFAAQHGIRLIGLNCPYPVIRLVSQYGLENLPDELKNLLPTVDLTNKQHRLQFEEALAGSSGHGQIDPATFERMYQSQTLWDEYMADSAANYVRQYPDSTLVIIAGVGHVMGRVGIPDRIFKRTQQNPFVIVPEVVDWLDNGLPDIEKPLTAADCDWAWYTEKELPA